MSVVQSERTFRPAVEIQEWFTKSPPLGLAWETVTVIHWCRCSLDASLSMRSACVALSDNQGIDGSTARRCTAIVTNQRRARFRQSVKFLVSRVFKNTVGVVQSSADITAK